VNFRDLLEFAPDAVVVIGRDGVIRLVNSKTEAMFGYQRDEMVGRPIEILVPVRSRDVHVGFRDRYMAEPRARPMGIGLELAGRRKDGGEFPVEISLAPLDTAEGLLVTAAVRDISDRKRAQDSIRRSEERFRSLVVATAQIVWMTDADGRVTEGIPAWQEFTGQTFEDLRRGGWTEAIHPEDRERAARAWAEAVAARGDFEVEYRLRRRDGQYRRFHVRGVPVFGADGAVREWVGACTDVTERRRAEEEIRKLSSAVEQAGDAVFITDREGRIEYVNPAFEALTGYSRAEAAGATPRILKSGAHDREFYARLWSTVLSGQVFRGVVVNRRKDGSRYYEEKVIAPLKDAAGNVTHFVSTGRDITDRITAEQEIRRLNEELEDRVRRRTAQLEEANRELESFSYSVSHDLRAPLRHLTGFAELLAKSAPTLDDKGRRYLKNISEAASRMGRLVDDLLGFSRMGRREMQSARVDMNALVADVRRELAGECEGRRIEWVIGGLPPARGDPSMLHLVLANLVGNAIKYTRTRTTARIEIGRAADCPDLPGQVVYFVRDNGVGFDMRYAHKLFGVFQRLHTEEQFEGTGIGLANVRRIVARHGGRTWAQGELDKGATLYFSLPAG
jgi:PAS domain S-box-containing protein